MPTPPDEGHRHEDIRPSEASHSREVSLPISGRQLLVNYYLSFDDVPKPTDPAARYRMDALGGVYCFKFD